jgi:hypothetical protein
MATEMGPSLSPWHGPALLKARRLAGRGRHAVLARDFAIELYMTDWSVTVNGAAPTVDCPRRSEVTAVMEKLFQVKVLVP